MKTTRTPTFVNTSAGRQNLIAAERAAEERLNIAMLRQ